MAWGNGDGKGNNPWGTVPPSGGGGRGGPPPEYDDLLGNLLNRLRGMLPRFLRGRGISVILVVVLVLWALSGFFKVQPAEEGVILRFGEWVRTEQQGLHYHIPFPVERVIVLNVEEVTKTDIGFRSQETQRRRTSIAELLGESLMLTGDENIVNISFSVFWKINDAKNYLFNIQPPQTLTVKQVAESVMREIIGKTDFQSAMTEDRGPIQIAAQAKLQEVLNFYGAGILITQIQLEKVVPPAEVNEAFLDVQAAVANSESYQNEAQAYANTIVPQARGNAVRKIQQAEAYKEQVIARAIGEASRFIAVYEQYAKAKDVTRKRIYLETMEEVLTGMTKVIVDEGAGTGVIPYLPLPELKTRQDRSEGGGQ